MSKEERVEPKRKAQLVKKSSWTATGTKSIATVISTIY
jgi:hypothetical protein